MKPRHCLIFAAIAFLSGMLDESQGDSAAWVWYGLSLVAFAAFVRVLGGRKA
jgi:hypothetical protein